jgi:NADH:ubiquinone oxidoreductase subunit 4 (subunit M)
MRYSIYIFIFIVFLSGILYILVTIDKKRIKIIGLSTTIIIWLNMIALFFFLDLGSRAALINAFLTTNILLFYVFFESVLIPMLFIIGI